jgi:hypothetical protein
MEKNKNNMEKVREINREWRIDLEKDTSLSILMYEPFTTNDSLPSDYWTEKYRIVFCNLEPGAYPENTNGIMDIKCFTKLLEEKKLTIKNTAMFIYYLYNTLHCKNIDMEMAKKNNALLMDSMQKVTYMNLLQDTGDGKFDEKYFNDFYYHGKDSAKNRKNIYNLITALDPDIFIVTGAGKDLIQKLYEKEFEKNQPFLHNSSLYVYLPHPASSGWHKGFIPDRVNMIMECLALHNLKKEK